MPPTNCYTQLTEEFNRKRFRAILSSGQAVVMHRLAMVSKDGDWIIREDEEAATHIRRHLAGHGAVYRFGAPLDPRWLAGGWSSHLEFRKSDQTRVRTDFFSRPPRISPEGLARMWEELAAEPIPFLGATDLALVKMTQREKDYPIIGELIRRLSDTASQLQLGRSARDLIRIAQAHPEETTLAMAERPLLEYAQKELEDELAQALDAERRRLMKVDELRLNKYQTAATEWAKVWPEVDASVRELPLDAAHAKVVEVALQYLPFSP